MPAARPTSSAMRTRIAERTGATCTRRGHPASFRVLPVMTAEGRSPFQGRKSMSRMIKAALLAAALALFVRPAAYAQEMGKEKPKEGGPAAKAAPMDHTAQAVTHTQVAVKAG